MDDSLRDPPLPSFATIDEECAFWKNRCIEIKQNLIEAKQDYSDFEEQSRQLENELEAQLEQREKTLRDLKSKISQIENDNESLRVSRNDIISGKSKTDF